MPMLIVVLGLPASGKTHFAQHLAQIMQLPVQHKDVIKEVLGDQLGCTTLEQSRQLGRASMLLLYQWAATLLAAGQSCIIESTFHPHYATTDVAALQTQYGCEVLQIRCHAPQSVLLARIQARITQRHGVHFDQAREQSDGLSAGLDDFLAVAGTRLTFDTTTIECDGYSQIVTQLRELLPHLSRSISWKQD